MTPGGGEGGGGRKRKRRIDNPPQDAILPHRLGGKGREMWSCQSSDCKRLGICGLRGGGEIFVSHLEGVFQKMRHKGRRRARWIWSHRVSA